MGGQGSDDRISEQGSRRVQGSGKNKWTRVTEEYKGSVVMKWVDKVLMMSGQGSRQGWWTRFERGQVLWDRTRGRASEEN